MKELVLKEISKEFSEKYNIKEKVIMIMLEKCGDLGYNIFESRNIIIDFFNLSKTCPYIQKSKGKYRTLYDKQN